MMNKKRLLFFFPLCCLLLILFSFTSCRRATVDFSDTERQEWLSQVPAAMTVTNLRGKSKEVTYGFRKSAVVNTLQTIRLDCPLEKGGVPDGAYSVILKYPNAVIRYTFYGTVLWVAVNGETAGAYAIRPDLSERIGCQLRNINPC